MKDPLITIIGPTASGKSSLAVALAHHYNGAVISADSRQVYEGMNIGSGKITEEEMEGIPHYLLDVTSPQELYTVTDFVRDAEEALTVIQKEGRLPFVCGGTGMYLDALLRGHSFPEVAPNLPLREELEKESVDALFETLKEKDADRATTIDPHNKRRIVRALEIVEALGKVPQQKKKPEKHVLWIGIEVDAETLRTRIAKRLTERMDQGMIEEVAALHASGTSWEKLESFGLEYRFIARYLQKNICKEEMLEKLRFAINGYARRQRTWFRKHDDIHWVQSSEEASRLIDSFIATP